ncbi:hypothetical protein [Paenibacillus sp. NEAU-GSW1]|uniref:hypothetical protein n=1 Tax=Paenibacillus sp. NEAU-GSW1 TaxID=2682486 RepID=UPI0012E2FA3A|nr:hypothetical protein [Paenibacillus sp. NEAU-GSW1]MUT67041.1 hypothetical protein [Paenibacillus sp. NEAU-GSW1]
MSNETEFSKQGGKRIGAVVLVLLIVVAAAVLLFYFMLSSLKAKSEGSEGTAAGNHPTAYAYEKATATNGMELHVLATKPSNVTLETIQNNVALTPDYGINGGFFYEKALLSIAVVNSLPVNGAIDEYGSGSKNVKYKRGTLVWDGANNTLSVQVVGDASELKVMDHTRFWAQGGISMSLGKDEAWEQQILAEQAPYPDEARLRSAAIYDRNGILYLVVSSTKGTLAEFRDAIVEEVGDGLLEDGIFLDGDGSSQLRSAEAQLTGDNRPVVQMMKIVK